MADENAVGGAQDTPLVKPPRDTPFGVAPAGWSLVPVAPTADKPTPVFVQRPYHGELAMGDEVEAEFGEITAYGGRGAQGPPGSGGIGYEEIFARTSRNSLIANTQLPRNTWTFRQPGVVGGVSWQPNKPPPTTNFQYVWSCRRRINGDPNVGDGVPAQWETPVLEQRGTGSTPPAPPRGQRTETIYMLSELPTPNAIAPANDWRYQQPKTSGTLVNLIPGGPRRADGLPPVGSWVASNASSLATSSWTLTNPDGRRIRFPQEWLWLQRDSLGRITANPVNQFAESITISSTGQVTLNLNRSSSDPQGISRSRGNAVNYDVLDDLEIELIAGTNQRVAAGPPTTDRSAPYTWTDAQALAFVQALVAAGNATAPGRAVLRSGYPWYILKPIIVRPGRPNSLPGQLANLFECDRYYMGTLTAGAEVPDAWQTVERGSAA